MDGTRIVACPPACRRSRASPFPRVNTLDDHPKGESGDGKIVPVMRTRAADAMPLAVVRATARATDHHGTPCCRNSVA